jgi:hypothetical protein
MFDAMWSLRTASLHRFPKKARTDCLKISLSAFFCFSGSSSVVDWKIDFRVPKKSDGFSLLIIVLNFPVP